MKDQLKAGVISDIRIATHLLLGNEEGDPSFFYSGVITNFCFGIEKLIKLILLEKNPILLLKKISPNDIIDLQKKSTDFIMGLMKRPFEIIECKEAWSRLTELIDSETILQLDHRVNRIRNIRNDHSHCHCSISAEKLARIAKLDCWIIIKALLELLPSDSLVLNDIVGHEDSERLEEMFVAENVEELAIISSQYEEWQNELNGIAGRDDKKHYLYGKTYEGDAELNVTCPLCKREDAYISFYASPEYFVDNEGFVHDMDDPIDFSIEFQSFICINCGIASDDKWELTQLGIWNKLKDIAFHCGENRDGKIVMDICRGDKDDMPFYTVDYT